jgi:hypothetical protein
VRISGSSPRGSIAFGAFNPPTPKYFTTRHLVPTLQYIYDDIFRAGLVSFLSWPESIAVMCAQGTFKTCRNVLTVVAKRGKVVNVARIPMTHGDVSVTGRASPVTGAINLLKCEWRAPP